MAAATGRPRTDHRDLVEQGGIAGRDPARSNFFSKCCTRATAPDVRARPRSALKMGGSATPSAQPASIEAGRALDSIFGRIFCGKPASTFPENAVVPRRCEPLDQTIEELLAVVELLDADLLVEPVHPAVDRIGEQAGDTVGRNPGVAQPPAVGV